MYLLSLIYILSSLVRFSKKIVHEGLQDIFWSLQGSQTQIQQDSKNGLQFNLFSEKNSNDFDGFTCFGRKNDFNDRSLFSEFLQNLATTTLDDVTPDQRLSELFRHEMTSQLKAMRVECRNWVASSFR